MSVASTYVQIQRYPLFENASENNPLATVESGDIELAKNKKEELTIKLEAMGYDVGYRFAERFV